MIRIVNSIARLSNEAVLNCKIPLSKYPLAFNADTYIIGVFSARTVVSDGGKDDFTFKTNLIG